MQKAVATDAEIHKGGLDTRLDIDDAAFVDIPHIAFLAGPLNVQFFEDPIFDDGNPAFLGLQNIDEHFFLFHGRHFLRLEVQGFVRQHLGCGIRRRWVLFHHMRGQALFGKIASVTALLRCHQCCERVRFEGSRLCGAIGGLIGRIRDIDFIA